MRLVKSLLRFWRSCSTRLSSALQGFVTIMALTDSGWMRRFRLPKRLVFLSVLMVMILLLSAILSLMGLFRVQYHLSRLAYLEEENRSLTLLLEGQAEQLSRLKLEMARLKEFERGLRAVSGLDSPSEPVVATGQGGGRPIQVPRQR